MTIGHRSFNEQLGVARLPIWAIRTPCGDFIVPKSEMPQAHRAAPAQLSPFDMGPVATDIMANTHTYKMTSLLISQLGADNR